MTDVILCHNLLFPSDLFELKLKNKLISVDSILYPDVLTVSITKKDENKNKVQTPVLLVEVKLQLNPNNPVQNKSDFSDLFNCMCLVREKYGLVDVIGVLTDLKDCFFCWFIF